VTTLEEQLSRAALEGLDANFVRWLRFVGAGPGEWTELQALKVKTTYATRNRFAHADTTAAALVLLRQSDSFKAQGVYTIANRVNPAVATRREARKWHDTDKGEGTSDRDITHRLVLFIDIDADRPSGTSATTEEMARTVPVAEAIYAAFADVLGDARALGYAHSGNGRQIFVALDAVVESPALAALIRGILGAVSVAFAAPGTTIDKTVGDAKRLVPAFGTVKRKGATGIAERPHRSTAFLCSDDVARLRMDDLERLLATLLERVPTEQRGQVSAGAGRKADDPWRAVLKRTTAGGDFTRANAIAVEEVARALGILDEDNKVRCPGCGNTDGVALVNNGLKCHHKTCVDRGVSGTPGFRTPVDLVVEVRSLEAVDAARWLLARFFGEDAPSPRARAKDADAEEGEAEDEPPPPEDGDLPSGFIGRDFPLTDIGNAERFVAHHGTDVRYCHEWKKWLVWDGARWALDRRAQVDLRATQTVRAIGAEAAHAKGKKKRDALRSHARDSESASSLGAMVKVARVLPGVPVVADELDVDPWRLNCRNGTIDLRTGVLHAHHRADHITKLAPVAYDAAAECPLWRKFLSDIMGRNDDLVGFLQRAVGYSLTGSVDEQVLFFLHGSGSNGKSTFLRTLLELVGDYGIQTAPDILIAKNQEGHPTEVADLFGCRLAVCQELEAGRPFAEAKVKQLTGGDIIRARRMREDFWSFKPTQKFFLAANHKPTIRGTDLAIWRRIRLIPFTVTIDGDKKDPLLLEKLRAERPGIVRWAVEGCLEWQRLGGLRAPKEVLDATTLYRQEQDVFGEFIEDRFDVAPHFAVQTRDLLRDYRVWCELNGHREMSPKALGAQLTARGFRRGREKHQRCWHGLRVRTLGDQTDVRAPSESRDGDLEPRSFFEDL
jgi:P4 family phage/plasmid primase-like protien